MLGYRIGLPFWKSFAKLGIPLSLRIIIKHDEEANVYYATSPDLKSLIVESDTIENLLKEIELVIEDLLEVFIAKTHTIANPKIMFPSKSISI
ncbi:DUF1902 domain-containing protein [Taylorella equigenitalis]|uniref:DUF1902 domain-containing protein n=1 Tax=Taylorella equigenitalis TaxID=29575 RepID=UPI000419B248|nr:DUF1902 domain-containing protein [Taylorella equigenitalis]ASY30182.1 hypothetical protein B9Z30_02090 [Taylorella equigenitalis]KOS58499.1 hypothetical protein AM589_06405 [Taylorella equigenitalis]